MDKNTKAIVASNLTLATVRLQIARPSTLAIDRKLPFTKEIAIAQVNGIFKEFLSLLKEEA